MCSFSLRRTNPKPVPMMHEPVCRGHVAPAPPEISMAPAQSGARPLMAAGTLSARLLPAHEEHDQVAVLSVHGEIDLGTAPTLRDVLQPVLEHQTGPVVVDLSTVSFMDSSGVHLLVETLRRLERAEPCAHGRMPRGRPGTRTSRSGWPARRCDRVPVRQERRDHQRRRSPTRARQERRRPRRPERSQRPRRGPHACNPLTRGPTAATPADAPELAQQTGEESLRCSLPGSGGHRARRTDGAPGHRVVTVAAGRRPPRGGAAASEPEAKDELRDDVDSNHAPSRAKP